MKLIEWDSTILFENRGDTIQNHIQIIYIIPRVEKILKVSPDFILSPARSCEHLNFLFSFLLPKIAGHCQQTLLITSRNVLPLHLKPTFPPVFELSLKVKVMGLNSGYLLKSFLLYYLFQPTKKKRKLLEIASLSYSTKNKPVE